MRQDLVYHTEYKYLHSSYDSSSDRTAYGEAKYIPWDCSVSFAALILPKEAGFIDQARLAEQQIEHGHRFVVTHLRIGGEASSVLIPIVEVKIDALTKMTVLEAV